LLELLENHGELTELTLADILNFLQESDGGAELSRQAIELERKISDWQDPAHLSPNHIKLLTHLTQDRGLTPQSLATGALKELQSARGTTDPNVESDFSEAPQPHSEVKIDINADFLKQIQEAQRRNAAGGNRRVVG
ncbi:MAG TPA: hypothetical protein VHM90_08145, partial [Phycisphaerae bacterium]|nr:hypothetical protein [Phycisphaerae bacterium]